MIRNLLLACTMCATMSVAADSYTLPFNFVASEATFGECVTFDLNRDEQDGQDNGIWSYNANMGAFRYTYHDKNSADDWIILPSVDFGGVKKVKVTVTVQAGGYDEKFEVKLGLDREPAAMTVAVLEQTYSGRDVKTFMQEVTLPSEAAGTEWALGIHATSDADKNYLDVREVSIVSADAPTVVPNAPTVSNNKVEGYGYSCTVTMPIKNVDGSDITDAMKLVVLVDGVETETRTGCEPGSAQPVSMTLAVGTHKVSFKAVTSQGESALKTMNVTIKESGSDEYSLPFVFSGTQDHFNECLTFDENGDKDDPDTYDYNYGIWSYNTSYSAFKYTYHPNKTETSADDWIILPLVDFGTVRKVKVSMDARTEYDTENFEVWLGRERTVEGMTVEVLKREDYTHKDSFETLSAEVSLPEADVVPDADNKWCIGVHATSPANHYSIYVNNFKIEGMISSGIDGIGNDESEAEYYDMQGMRILKPKSGQLVIERRDGKVVKRIIR